MSVELRSKPVQILLVEDSPDDVELTMEGLKEGKILHDLHVAVDGVQALEFLQHQGEYVNAPEPDIILLDLNLPKKDGREVLAELKSDPDLKRIPVVVLTTSKDEDDVVKAYDLHANAFITKPVDLDQFLGVVRSVKEFWLDVVTLPNGGDGGGPS